MKKDIIIVGAGLCGSLLAIRMAQLGYEVRLYEKRGDMRKAHVDAGRSINLALSDRGLDALDRVGIKDQILEACIPMRGRMIHTQEGEVFLSPYSGREKDHINSVSRSGLNMAMLDLAEEHEHVSIIFDAKVVEVDIETAEIAYIKDGERHSDKGDVVIGTDGAGSVVRRSLMGHTTKLLFNYSQDFLRHGYKELSILPEADGGWKIHKEALHIWPRGDFMIIALPNLDGSFTLTMFHPFETEIGFNHLDTRDKVQAFFEEYYSELLPYIPHYLDEYFENPVGTLGTIKCYPWQANGKVLVLGDAAHAIVPFYGQGMNASFEDVRVFDDLYKVHGDDWETLFKAVEDHRKQNTDAIADLAIDNFYEMRDKVDDVPFIRKRKIEMQLEHQFEDYYSKYSLVTFRPELSYHTAMTQGRKQDEILLSLCEREDYASIPLEGFYQATLKARS